MHLKITSNQTPQIEEQQIIISSNLLHLLNSGIFTTILLEENLTLNIATHLTRLLKNNGIINVEYNDQVKILLEAAGIYHIKDSQFQKKEFIKKSIIQIQQAQLINSYGKYNYIEQNFINNPFKEVLQDEKQEIINEDELLNDGVQVKQIESCASKPRACANCTCGRKEAEEQQDKDKLIEQLKSGTASTGCGSCYLGDAFRCANCPYRGLPAFKDGEQIKVLQGNMQLEEEVQQQQVKLEDGKVKIQI